MLSIRVAAPLAMLILSGCVSGPDHSPPTTDLPMKYAEGGKESTGDVSMAAWWTAFNDKRLNGLVEQGLAQNLDILQAMERITSAEASVIVAGAGALPSLTASADHTESKTNGISASDKTSTSSGGLSVSWLLDLFGEYKRSKESANASLDAAYANADTAKLTYMSELVKAYIDARYYQQRIAVARKALGSRRETLELTKLQLEAGAASRLDVVQSEGLVNSTLADLPGFETNFRQSAHRVATLLGLPASSLIADLQKGAPQPVARVRVKAGIPADLIRNRPDIRAAERTLASYVAEIGVAEAQLYPSITLGGSISPSYIATSALGGTSTSWSFGPSLSLPILDGGSRKANVDIAKSSAREQYLAWKQTVLNAVEEVENALAAVNRDSQTVNALTATVRSYEEALQLSTASYKDGASSLLDVLDAQRSVTTAEADLAQAVQQMAADFVSLNVAIGGGYAFNSGSAKTM
ncbi:efflux transporter outer membrane subunit [Agrobacterium sp. a22-2]|uniref:efflux transporter outer membrane subunit n=1 Tax=Agrobacterium sp. a22-2 TaxID=2283840 RepID=UPI001445FB57|nr:efflux transporter outer membrane subunit [Agrobacterium sp. a22-2]NKN39738.1 efflux transporter outer membrane subunit [Agrobacterium sp. a22-2]